MVHAKNCETVSTFVKVMQKKPRGFFFSGHGVCRGLRQVFRARGSKTSGRRPRGGEVWGGGCAPSPENFLTFALKMVHFGTL